MVAHQIESAPRSSDSQGRLFFCVNTRMDGDVFNHGEMVLHDYSTNQLTQFSKAMGVAAMRFPEKIIERFQHLEPTIAHTIAEVRRQAGSLPGDQLRTLLDEKFDVTVLLKSRGGGAAIAAMFNQYLDTVVGQEGIETVGCSAIASAAHTMFAHGKRRLALPSTKLMMHRAGHRNVANVGAQQRSPEAEGAVQKWIAEVDDPAFERVLLSIQEPERSKMAHLFEREKEPWTAERRINYKAEDAPGFVTAYLDENLPIHVQLSQRYGVPIPLAQFERYAIAEFAMLSEIERDIEKSRFADKDILLSVAEGRLRMRGSFDNQIDGPHIMKLIEHSLSQHLQSA